MNDNKRVIYIYSAFQFFFSLLIWIPVFYEYQKQIGLNDVEIFRIQSLYYLAFLFLEIPTGYLADRIGYKSCLKWGALTLVAANMLPIFVQNYDGFLWHFFLIALARSFISGASAAYLYDYLAQNNSQQEFKKVEGKARAYGLIGKVACWAVIGALMKWHLTLPYWLTTASAAVSVYFAFVLPDVVKTRDLNSKIVNLNHFGHAFKHLITNKYLIFIVLQGIGIFTLVRIAQVNLYQPILNSKSFDLVAFGWIMALMTLFEALGSAYPEKLQRWMSDLNAVSFTTLVMAASLMMIPFVGQNGVIFALILFSIASGASFPIQKQLMNDAIVGAAQYRATLLSLESLVDRAACAWMASLIGASLSAGKLNDFLVYSGLITIAFILLLHFVLSGVKFRRRRQQLAFEKGVL